MTTNEDPTTTTGFTDAELWTLRETLRERYGHDVELQLGEAEMRLNRQARQLVTCPIAAWNDGDCTLLIAKAGMGDFRCEFFYRLHQHYGTGIDRFDNLAEGVVTLLQVQADHAHQLEQEAEEPAPR
jgi:hypothetical protein